MTVVWGASRRASGDSAIPSIETSLALKSDSLKIEMKAGAGARMVAMRVFERQGLPNYRCHLCEGVITRAQGGWLSEQSMFAATCSRDGVSPVRHLFRLVASMYPASGVSDAVRSRGSGPCRRCVWRARLGGTKKLL
jgi:hypothetical protein